MFKLIWILRFTLHMNNRTHCGIRYEALEARAHIGEFDEWREECPKDTADECISCWGWD